VLSVIVFFYPNLLGQVWPFIILLIVNVINTCAICWKDILYFYIKIFFFMKRIVKIYNRTIGVRGLFIIEILSKFFSYYKNKKINPVIVKYYYKISNQPITKIIINNYIKFNNFICKTYLLLVGISETLRAKTNDITILCLYIKNFFTIKSIFSIGYSLIISSLELTFYPIRLVQSNSFIRQYSSIKNDKIMDNHNNEIRLEFKQWFAGLTDGDGYIYVTKEGYVGFEVTLNSMDEKVLRILQNKFGGNVHARAGLKAIRYRSQNKNTVYKIIQCLNGLVINNVRLAQLHKACLALNIPIKDPSLPDINSAYISGLLDSDGHINIYKYFYKDTYRYQLTIAISNNSLCNIEFLTKVIGGKCYFDKTLNGHYKWVANSKLLHLNLYDYFFKYPPKTVKRHKTFLIKEFHELNELKAYLETEKVSVRYKIWQDFYFRWNNKN
jgi:LAGLIDADG endonuclease